ncbi:MAG: Rrf2 family transcriptional regulator, iron-sulfur cluster assembly transcription factor [Pseudomonadota bacterium]|jgi:Rrf2 family iron-sulfur cluster assembly transcriptional regulator|nr:Rrf2 family transcriptional regulator [Burkholderiales bacterium]MBP9769400.1 Rrf2 family transcriptional regulator [Burkholderiales bacterium]MDQ5948308.1 Rrf2 family transcriptional regulator, iron-sulfur cluster assembly transcription factor [Pseudomonadota bacterium]
MKLTTKGKFAVTALLDIAIYSEDNKKPITLYNISDRQNISLSYLEQLFVKLRKSGVVKSYKGPGGGYLLMREVDKIDISEIIKAVDEDMDARSCRGNKNCRDNRKCLTHDLWAGLTNEMYGYLERITIKDLLDKAETKEPTKIMFCRT